MASFLKFDRSYGISCELFDSSIPPFSPVFGDVERKVSYDEEGKEIITFVPVDYVKLNKERGTVDDWSLDALLKSGVNTNFGLHTGSSVSRLEGISDIQGAANDVDFIFAEPESNVEESK